MCDIFQSTEIIRPILIVIHMSSDDDNNDSNSNDDNNSYTYIIRPAARGAIPWRSPPAARERSGTHTNTCIYIYIYV